MSIDLEEFEKINPIPKRVYWNEQYQSYAYRGEWPERHHFEFMDRWEGYKQRAEIAAKREAELLAEIERLKAGEPVAYKFEANDLLVERWSSLEKSSWSLRIPIGVKITHISTGKTVTCDTQRSQHANRERALRALWLLVSNEPIYASPQPSQEKGNE